jgi:hypothetical protein
MDRKHLKREREAAERELEEAERELAAAKRLSEIEGGEEAHSGKSAVAMGGGRGG